MGAIIRLTPSLKFPTVLQKKAKILPNCPAKEITKYLPIDHLQDSWEDTPFNWKKSLGPEKYLYVHLSGSTGNLTGLSSGRFESWCDLA